MKTLKFIEKGKKVHGDRYDYSEVVYIKATEKVNLICKEHGIFEQQPSAHLSGQNCPKCRGYNKTTLEVINEFTKVHGDRYDYSEVVYVKSKQKVKIICKEHGVFEQTPNTHLSEHGCPICNEKRKLNSEEQVIKSFNEIHGDRYDYSEVVYKTMGDKVNIICKKHGIFKQTPRNHKQGRNCPKCRIYHSYFRDREFYKGKKTILYYIFLPDYNLYKIGITIKSVKERFSADNIKYNILSEEIFIDGSLAFDKEQRILNETINEKYQGIDILNSGNTELRTEGII